MKKEFSTFFSTGIFTTFIVTSLLVLCCNLTGFAQCVTGSFSPQFTGMSLTPAGPFADESLIPIPTAASDDGSGGTGCVVTVTEVGVRTRIPANPAACETYQINIDYEINESDGSTDMMAGTLTTMVDPTLCVPIFSGDGNFNEQCLANAPHAPTAVDCIANDLTVTETSDTNNGGSGNNGDPLVITRTYTATTTCGGTVIATQIITIEDTTPANAVCMNITAQLDASGNVTIAADAVNNGSTDNCGIAQFSTAPNSFNCSDIGANSVTLLIQDEGGNISNCMAVVTIEENTNPVAVCQNITIQSDINGDASIIAAQVNNGSSDNCGSVTLSIDISTFDCTNVGGNTVVLTATDGSLNTNTCNATVTVEDNIAPQAICQNLTVQLDNTGNIIVAAASIDNGSNDACGIVSMNLDMSAFTCTDIGANAVVLTVADANGNNSNCNATITVEDDQMPTATCQNITVQLDATGNATLVAADLNDSSTDNCGNLSFAANQTAFTCANLGANNVTLTVSDNTGNADQCTAVVTAEDNVPPTALCMDATIFLNAAGNASVTVAQINNGSNDACGLGVLSLDNTAFTCANTGANTVMLTVNDANGNSATCNATVTVADNILPTATCQNATIQLNATGNASITAANVNNGSTDNCNIASLSVAPNTFDCSNIGNENVTLTVTDDAGNPAICTAIVTIEDNIDPTPICQDVNVVLDNNGNVTVSAASVDNGSSDNCNNVNFSLSQTTFDCTNIGANAVTLTVTDNQTNSANCNAMVNVSDNAVTNPVCQNITIQLDAGGDATITAAQIDGGSTDNCGIMSIAASTTTFTCADAGANTVVLTVNDVNGNSETCDATVTVQEMTDPVAMCMSATLQLDVNGEVTVLATDIDNGSTDNCNNVNFTVNPANLTCVNLGANNITLTVTDDSGNSDDCIAVITVQDMVDPTAVCQNITAQLDADGNATIVAADLDGGGNDACGIANRSANITAFTCANLGANNVTLTVTDNSGNNDNCVAVVTIQDMVDPTAVCQNITLPLDAAGNVSIVAADIDNGSADNCGAVSLSASPLVFNCSNVGANTVMLTADDGNGNTASCNATVTIEDDIDPNEICQNVTVQLDATGNGTILATAVDNGSTDNCGIMSLVVSQNTVTCTDIGTLMVTLTVTDNNGNMETCMATVTVEDNQMPTAICQNIPLVLDNSGNATIVATDLDNGSSDACSAVTFSASQLAFTCADLGANDVMLFVEDADGNIGSCTAIVTVTENAPMIVGCPSDIDMTTNGNCMPVVTFTEPTVVGCGYVLQSALPFASGDMFPQGTTTVTYTFGDGTNTLTCVFDVTVTDMGAGAAPMLNCGSLTAGVAANTDAGVCVADGFNLTPVMQTDDCGAGNLTLTYTISFAGMADITGTGIIPTTQNFNEGVSTVDYVLTDNSGNSDQCSFTVTVNDVEMPTLDCSAYQLAVNVNVDGGMCTNSNVSIPVNPMDNCGIASLTYNLSGATAASSPNTGINDASIETFNSGTTLVEYITTDVNGITANCTFNVVVADNENPMITCPIAAVLTVNTDSGICGFTQTGTTFDPTFSDNCPGVLVENDRTDNNTLMTESFPLGTTTVIWTATDGAGNEAMCTINIIVQDNEDPEALCQNLTVQLDASGDATITGAQIDGGSTDNCGIMSVTANPVAFTCANVGMNNVTLAVTDNSSNTDQCTAVVTVEDNVNPSAVCQASLPIQLNANGMATILAADLNNGSSDACGIASFSASQTAFDCGDVGNIQVTLTVTDNNGNTDDCLAFVAISDMIDPTAVCQNITIQLDAAGNANLTGAQIDGGSTDACGINTLVASSNTFTCANVGANNVDLTVTDVNGNSSTCTAIVTVQDTEDPTAICQDITVNLDAAGNASITAAQIDNGSNDNCGSVTLSIMPNTFDCSNMGANTVTLSVTDDDNNTATCDATVTIVDPVSPVAVCQSATIDLDATGNATLPANLIDNGSTDACGIISYMVAPNTFDCSNVGANNVALTVEDANGNMSSCNASVMVNDVTNPTAQCQDVTLQLDAAGNATLTTTQVDNGSSDACGISSLSLNMTNFDCTNIGANPVVLTITDNNGNTANCNSSIIVEDNVAPIAICQDITLSIDASGSVTVTAAQINNGSNDNCGIASTSVNPTMLTCANVGANTITLTVNDVNGNTATCDATVTVNDANAPTAVCMNATVQLDATGNVTLDPALVDDGSTAPCGTMTLSVSPNTFTCANVGNNTVTLTVTANNGMTANCMATVTVEDNVVPMTICQDFTTQLNGAGNATINAGDIDNGSSDACGIAMLTVSPNTLDCTNVGGNMVTLTVTDNHGNAANCTANVMVEDNINPNPICQNITVQLDATGNAAIVATDIDNGSNDACGIANLSASIMAFTCANIGNNSVILTVTDNNGNTANCNANVVIEDNIDPIAICQNITVQLNVAGNVTITGNDLDNGSSDACGILNYTAFPNSFTCADIGDNNVVLTVEDNNGNTDMCNATVTVEDTEDPVALCQDLTIQLDANGDAAITAAQIDNGSSDNCGIASITVSPKAFDCSNMGDNTVTLTVTDTDNNTAICIATVTVEDTTSPVAICQNITIQLDATGNVTLDPALINNGSSDACGTTTFSVLPTTFDCTNVGLVNMVMLTVEDAAGNTSTCTADVTVEDNIHPTALCQDISVNLDNTGNVTINAMQIDNGSSDACGLMSVVSDIFNFDCTNVGENAVVLTVTDMNGNSAICNATVTVIDNEDPTAVCQNISVGVGATGNVTILASQINNGSSDNCNIASLSVSPNTFTCNEVGNNTVTLTVTDASNNEATCMAVVNITDSTVPMAICQDITVQLDATGNATITPTDVDNGSTAACGTMNLVVSQTNFDCSDAGTIVVVVLTASDNNGNSDDCTANVTVEDNVAPVALCTDLTINLDATGNATLLTTQVDNGSNDACGIASLMLSQTAFTCANIGEIMVTLTATDVEGNTDICTATVGVIASAACTSPTITNVNGPTIADPCTCIGNGQFSEEIVIETMNGGQMWVVQTTTLIDPNTGNTFPAGTPFIEQTPMGGTVQYTLVGNHLDGPGYTLSATSPFFPGSVLTISNNCFYPDPVIVTDLSDVICASTTPIVLEGNAGLMTNGNPIAGSGEFTLNGNVITEIDPAAIGVGNFLLTFTFDAGTAGLMDMDNPGCMESVTAPFEIQNTPNFQGCNDEVTIALGPTCEALITPDVILEGDFGCTNDYVVTITTQTGQSVPNPITSAYIGQTLIGTVNNATAGNNCSTVLLIEDSIAPTIDCQPITITCMDALPPFGTGVTGIDNCETNPDEILLNQVYNTADNCTDLVPNDGVAGFVTVTRTYIAQGASGMQSQPCTQVITITRPDDVDFPDDITWSCEQYAANPNIIDTFALNPLIVAGFGTEFPAGANGFGFDLTSMSPSDARLSNNLPGSVPPTPTGSGMPNVAIGTFCNYSVTSSQAVLGICGFPNSTNSPAFKILRTWTVLDWCTGMVIMTNDAGEDNLQVIQVMDVQGPVVTGIDVMLSTNIPASGNNPATTNGLIAMPPATDNCSGVNTVQAFIYSDAGLNNAIATVNANGVINPPLPVGSYFIGYTATDVCGNVSLSPAFNLVVSDSSIPTMICDEITAINVSSSGVATVPAAVFDDGSFDDCGTITFAARRISDNCGVAGNTAFGSTVTFCCADAAAGPISVVLQATDCTGNTNSCMVIVNVGDNIAPTIACPADATIDCDMYAATLRPQLLVCNLADACESTALTNAGYGDVTINDNCDATAQPTVNIDLNNCSEGTITRSFVADDASGNTSNTCTQTITITHVSDWVVEFGEDVTLNCGASNMTVADAFTAPEIFFETCEMIATSYQDETFTTVQNACFKVVRTWKVINWCTVGDDVDQETSAIELSETALGEDLNGDGVLNTRTFRDSYRGTLPTADNDPDADTQDGFIIYQQTVKVIDETAPVFVAGCTIPDVCITTNTCGATVTLPVPSASDCVSANLITINATSGLGTGFGPFNNVAPSVYDVIYSATDNCGNVTVCNTTVEVMDCKLPSPVCVEGLVVELMAINDPNNTTFEPMIEVLVNQINAGVSDNCPAAAGGLKISFSTDISDVVRTYNCLNVGDNTVRMYVTDAAGLQDYCETEITVQANANQCDDDLLVATLSGNVATEGVNDVEEVMIHINSPNMNMDNMTDAAGMFAMNVPMNGDYTIVPEKDDEHGNGVSTFDLVKISKHILNVQALDSPYKMIAADANNSQSITTLDLVHIRKMILLIEPAFTNNTSWRFVDASYVFPDPANPWLETFPEIISINNLEIDQLAEDFVAVKIGDVNGSAQVNQLMGADDRTDTETLTLMTNNVKLIAGETYAVAIHAANFDHFGYQFTMKFDTDRLAYERIENGLATADNFGTTLLEEGILTTSWHQAAATKLADKETLFTLHFTALTDGNLQDALHLTTNYTRAEAYTANGDLTTVELQFNQTASNPFALHQNRPNPFAEATTIGFYLPTAQAATLTITDVSGRVIYTFANDFAEGKNEVTLTKQEIGATGVLYYRLETNDGTETRKMIVE